MTLAMGYVIATAFLTFRDYGIKAEIDFFWLAQNYFGLRDFRPNDFRLANLIIGGFGLAGLLLSAVLSGSALTRFGRTHWQKASEMRKNGFFGKPGTGFIVGKMGKPKSNGKLITSKVFPHALIVAPTGRGKNDRLCHSQSADLQRLCRGFGRERRKLRGHRAASRLPGRRGFPLCTDRLA